MPTKTTETSLSELQDQAIRHHYGVLEKVLKEIEDDILVPSDFVHLATEIDAARTLVSNIATLTGAI